MIKSSNLEAVKLGGILWTYFEISSLLNNMYVILQLSINIKMQVTITQMYHIWNILQPFTIINDFELT